MQGNTVPDPVRRMRFLGCTGALRKNKDRLGGTSKLGPGTEFSYGDEKEIKAELSETEEERGD